jgi:DNA-binding response OmpR family regulator
MTTKIGRKPHILLVDDDVSLVELIEMYFEDRYELSIAKDAKEAFDLLAQRTPDLIVLDIMLPKMDGLQFLEKMRQMDAFRQLPVVLLTAKGTDHDIKIGMESGAQMYIPKPFDFDELFDVIERCLKTKK